MAKWEFFPEEYIYKKDGRIFPERSILRNIQKYSDSQMLKMDMFAMSLSDGEITIQQWTLRMREVIKRTHIVQYIIARGGLDRMTQSDWGRIGWVLRNQYAFLNQFANAISGGNLTVAQIQARSAMYINAARESYERGKAQGAFGLFLPAYPGDGTTECLSNCQCHWNIQNMEDHYECTWTLGEAEHCNTCVVRASTWKGLIFPKL